MNRSAEWMGRHQMAIYFAAVLLACGLGLLVPAIAAPAGAAITPILVLLLYATFLGVPFGRIGRAFGEPRFLGTVLVVNFVAVPVVVWVFSRIVAHDPVLLVGVCIVLLTPCIDYVIVFTGLAGGDRERLLAATPLLMLVQLLLLPLYLRLFLGPRAADLVVLAPFVEAFFLLIVLPLVLAGVTRLLAARTRIGRGLLVLGEAAMVPLMALTLAAVFAAQIAQVASELPALALAALVFVLFVAVMVPLGALLSRSAGLEAAERRAVVFSGVTRNSLVVLPLVLALPPAFRFASVVVVTQTLVELLAMLLLVRLVPRLIPPGSER